MIKECEQRKVIMKITQSVLVQSLFTPKIVLNGLFSLTLLFSVNLLAQSLSLSDAETLAVNSDPAQKAYLSQQTSLISQGIAASTLPDPMIKLGLANVPTDSFQLDQEAMTQMTVGLAQQFSRGTQRELTQKGFNQRSEIAVFQGLERQLNVKKMVRGLWLNIQLIDKSVTIVKENKTLFTSFYRDLESKFSLGLAENEDLILAEIEISKFDEKLAALNQNALNYRNLLSEYIGEYAYQELPKDTPKWPETAHYINALDSNNSPYEHYNLLANHPQAKMLSQSILVADNNIEFAEQAYKPSFKVEVGYGHRQGDRADLLSGFVTMDIPLFTDKRQDQTLISAQQIKGQKQAEHRLLLRRLNASLNAEISNFQQLTARITRYQESLLKQANLHTTLLEQSYQSNTRSFKEVIDAYIHEQNLSLEYQQLYFDGLKSLSNIRYFQAL
jgi:outer membrane protein TolC